VANPAHRTLGRVASLHLVRRFDAPSTFRHLFWVESPYLSIAYLEVLLLDLAQYLDLGKRIEDSGRVRSIELLEKPHAIGAHRLEVMCPGLLALGQPLVLDTPSVTLKPLRIGVLSVSQAGSVAAKAFKAERIVSAARSHLFRMRKLPST
jgi:hypothetical protein